MIVIVYPTGLNWFYARLATALESELSELGLDARAIPAENLSTNAPNTHAVILVVSPAECAHAVPSRPQFVSALRRYPRRVLVNYDSLHSHWFVRHLDLGDDLFTDVFDIGVVAQARDTHAGLPYHWIGEACWLRSATQADLAWNAGRPFPWTVIGHATGNRASLVSALMRSDAPNGFVYLPPLRPYHAGRGLGEAAVRTVLEQTNLYVWNSHHMHPYHEGLRAIQAVTAGAVPAKIDPFFASDFPQVPWVYPSLSALYAKRARAGLASMHAAAREFLDQFPSLGAAVVRALEPRGQLGVRGSR